LDIFLREVHNHWFLVLVVPVRPSSRFIITGV
jgi:hypothetical protein